MNNIILQPCSNPDAAQHYTDTIATAVALTTLQSSLSAQQFAELQQIYPSGFCQVWGLTPGKKEVNIGKWTRIKEGDVTLFASRGRIFSSATVTYKIHSRKAATQLWGTTNEGDTWEYMYFLDEVTHQDIPYASFNEKVGYQPNYVIQGFVILDDEKSERVAEAFDLSSETYIEPVDDKTYEDIVSKIGLLTGTDAEVTTRRRLEQGYLKQHLFGRHTIAACGICAREYPVSFLVTAHIKRRADCSLDERKDLRVVMPMCKFGCDELFERGYIGVEKGVIVDLQKRPATAHTQEKVEEVSGLPCSYYNVDTAPYFNWHLDRNS